MSEQQKFDYPQWFILLLQDVIDMRDAQNDYFLHKTNTSMAVAKHKETVVDNRLCGLDDPWWFHPYEFAGNLSPSRSIKKELQRIKQKNGYDVTGEEADLVIKWNCYTKKTGLWGEFNIPKKNPLFNVKTAPQGSFTQRLGGKAEKTKELRSITPLGFAYAFFEANKNYNCVLENDIVL